jgi:hypothetical protein
MLTLPSLTSQALIRPGRLMWAGAAVARSMVLRLRVRLIVIVIGALVAAALFIAEAVTGASPQAVVHSAVTGTLLT